MTPSKALCPTKRTRTCFSLALMIDKGSLNAAKLWWRSVDFYINFKTPQNWGQNTEPRCTTCSVIRKFRQLIIQAFQDDRSIWKCSGQSWDCCPSSCSTQHKPSTKEVFSKKERNQAQQNGQTIEESSEDRNKSTSMPKRSTALIFMLLIAIIFSHEQSVYVTYKYLIYSPAFICT